MPGLTFIPGLTQQAARLLEAAGIDKPGDLAEQQPDRLFERLAVLNAERQEVPGEISLAHVRRWVLNARAMVQTTGPAAAVVMAPRIAQDAGMINLDDIPEVLVLDSNGSRPTAAREAEPAAAPRPPAAAPPDWRATRSQQEFKPVIARPAAPPVVAGAELPHQGSVNRLRRAVTGGTGLPPAPAPAPEEPEGEMDDASAEVQAEAWKSVDKSRFRSFTSYEAGESGIAPLERKADPVGAPRSRHVKGGESTPRRIRRGVPYPRPVYLHFGAIVVVLFRILLLLVLIGTPIAAVPAFTETHDRGPLVNYLWVVGAWLFSGILYVYFASRIRCRVCTNHIFFSKRCFKNVKAHRIPGMGLVASLALHALVFGWFRCMYCGTAIRVRQ